MALLIVAVTVLLFAIGFEMILVLGIPSLLFKLTHYPHMPNEALLQKMVGGMNQSTLMAIPFFILAAETMAQGQIAARLAHLVRVCIGHYRGGVGSTTVATAMAFGSVSGSAAATVSAIGRLMYPELRKTGFSERFSIGLIASGSETALLIPPSITMIIFGWLTGSSITSLFAAGLMIGLLLGAIFVAYVYIESRIRDIGRLERQTMAVRWAATKDASWALGMPVIILGGIYSGAFTATEAASISVVYALFVESVVYRELTLRQFAETIERAAITSCVIFLLIGMGSILSFFLTLFQIPNLIIEVLQQFDGNLFIFLLVVNVVFIIGGMFLDPSSAMLILVPTLYPAAMALGVDPIHFGMIVTLNIAMAMITPPFGLDLFVASSALNKPVAVVIRSVLPFIVVNLIVLVLVTVFPAISTFFPRLLGY
jgi:C4-dicarboxylate transporter, DctM subunit